MGCANPLLMQEVLKEQLKVCPNETFNLVLFLLTHFLVSFNANCPEDELFDLERNVEVARHEEELQKFLSSTEWPKQWKAWGSLFGCFFLMFNSWGLVNAYGTFSSHYMQHLMPNRNLLQLSTIGSTESFLILIFSGIVGRVVDAGMARQLTIIGSIFVTMGMLSLAFCAGDGKFGQGNFTSIWVCQGLLQGLGMSCFFVSSSQIGSSWFPSVRKSFVVGVVASGASIAGFVYPILTKFLLGPLGWRNTILCVWAVVLVTCIVSCIFCVPNPLHMKRRPEKWQTWRAFVDLDAFHHRGFNCLTAATCFMFFGFYVVFFNLEEWAALHGFGYKDHVIGLDGQDEPVRHPKALRTFYLLSIMNGSSAVGRIGSAYLGDKIPTPLIHMTATGICSLLCLVGWIQVDSVESTIAFVVLFGVFSGSVIGLPPASMGWILGKHAEGQRRLGHWVGLMYTCSAIPAFVGPMIAGVLVSYLRIFLPIQLWAGICLGVSTVFMLAAWHYGRQHHETYPDTPVVPKGTTSTSTSATASCAPSVWADDEEKEQKPSDGTGASQVRTNTGRLR
ncbi:MFS general substrate transporter [Eremomyces bilateralis CBS 781.70]|uniref:MFS general substrate transporter n=1 Tax=Eremomyces bilateralis CBS 781.70 TaxID=1392243 RepID=A0A6G1G3S5_9PEZI|nr:MFS general substrate transporter [Eremomyces bilateralis CBS 781.70]KAF1812724.1 MFS general substrate transporter [Eremomyces bilateralis CBS 781.70]